MHVLGFDFTEINREREQIQAERDEALDALESLARRHSRVCPDGITCGSQPDNAGALRLLAKHGRFRVDAEASSGNVVAGYWPENDPQRGHGDE